jgi:hypothetical protein
MAEVLHDLARRLVRYRACCRQLAYLVGVPSPHPQGFEVGYGPFECLVVTLKLPGIVVPDAPLLISFDAGGLLVQELLLYQGETQRWLTWKKRPPQ